MVRMKIQSCCAFCQVKIFNLPVNTRWNFLHYCAGRYAHPHIYTQFIRQIGVDNRDSDMDKLQMIDRKSEIVS